MASALIQAIRTVSGNQPIMRRLGEKASQTFLAGVPVMMDLTVGYIKEWDGVTITNGIAGVAKEAASNLTTSGTAKTLTYGSVPNESSAVNIPRGAPLNDGRVAVELSNDDSVFFAQVGPSQTTAQTDLGQQYGMTKDVDGHWYVDKTKNNVGVNTVCTVVKLDPNDTARGVHVSFLRAVQQVVS